ncbi:MAG: hypothetical protein WC402_02340 [Candidatus Pacearchaeota archaeon]|jgi:hypothetical protein
MEKELGKLKKNETTEIIIRVDEYKGKKGLTIREFVTSEKYTGFTKAGTRISPENFFAFREMINSIDSKEFMENPEILDAKPKKEKKSKKETIKQSSDSSESELVPSEEELAQE